ncbi:MAG: hypothetical protein U0800_17925 [Isosphaeraceae bacterium]
MAANEKKTRPGDGQSPRENRQVRRQLNWKAALIAMGAVVLLAGGGWLLYHLQESRQARANLELATNLEAEGKPIEAIQHLRRLLDQSPRSEPEILPELTRLMDLPELRGAFQFPEVTRLNERLLALNPTGPQQLLALRRLARANLAAALEVRSDRYEKRGAEARGRDDRLQLAEKLLGQLKAAEEAAREDGRSCPAVDRSETYVLEGIAQTLNSPDNSGKTVEFAKALESYNKALEISPTNVEAAGLALELNLKKLEDPEGANRIIDRLASALPNDFNIPLFRAIVAEHEHREEDYRARLLEAQALAPDNIKIRINLVEDAIKRADLPEARRQFAAIPEALRNTPEILTQEVKILLAEHQVEKAQELLRGVNLASGGTDIRTMLQLVELYITTNQTAKARPLIANLQRQVASDVQKDELKFLEAEQLAKTGRFGEAREILMELQDGGFTASKDAELKKYEIQFPLILGQCHEGLGESDKAGEVYRTALVKHPNNPGLEQAYGVWLRLRDPEKAIALLEKSGKTIERSPQYRAELAESKLQKQLNLPESQRSWAEFDGEIDALLKQDPDYYPARLLKARRQYATSDLEAALATLEDLTTRDPKLAQAWSLRADVLTTMGKGDEALEVLERAAEPDALNNNIESRVLKARQLFKLNRARDARALMLRDLRDKSEVAQLEIWQGLYRLDAERGNQAELREDLKNWSRLEASDPRPTRLALENAIMVDDGPAADSLLDRLESILAEGPEPESSSASAPARRDGSARKDPIYRLARAAALVGLSPKSGTRLEEFRRTESQRYQAAKDEVREVLKQYPSMPAALQLDGEIASRLLAYDRRNGPVGPEREQAVIDAYRKAIDAGSALALQRLIDFLASSGRIAEIDSPKLKLPARLGTLNRDRIAAEACTRAGAKDDAIRFAERYVAANQSSPDAVAWKAQLMAMLGKGELYEADVQRLIEQRPTELLPWLALIQLRAQKGRAADIDALIQKAQAKVTGMTPEMIEIACRSSVRDFNRLDQAYQRALDRYPEDNAIATQAAAYYQDSGRPILAESKLREVLRRDPRNRGAIRMLAVLITERGQPEDRWQEAWNSLGTEAEGQPEVAEERYARAVLQLRAPDSENRRLGISRMKDVLADIPSNTNAAVVGRTELINGYLREQEFGPAIEVAADLAAKLPSAQTFAMHAETLLKGGRRDEALARLDEIARLAPGDAREAQLRIQLLWDPKQPESSAEALEACYAARAQSDPRAAEPLGLGIVSVLDAAGKLDAAEGRVAARMVEQNPGLSWIAAKLSARAGDKARALTLCETAVNKGTAGDRNEACNVAVGLAYDNPDPALRKQAVAVVDAAVKADRNSSTARSARAMMYHIQGRYDDEIKVYRELLGERLETPQVLNNLAWALCEFQDKPEEALKFANLAIERYGELPSLLDTRGVIYTRLKDRERALADLGVVVERQATPSRRFHLARALALGGDSANEQVRKERDQALRDGLKADTMEPREKADLEALRKL